MPETGAVERIRCDAWYVGGEGVIEVVRTGAGT